MAAAELLEPVNLKSREMKGTVVYAGSTTEGCIEGVFQETTRSLACSGLVGLGTNTKIDINNTLCKTTPRSPIKIVQLSPLVTA